MAAPGPGCTPAEKTRRRCFLPSACEPRVSPHPQPHCRGNLSDPHHPVGHRGYVCQRGKQLRRTLQEQIPSRLAPKPLISLLPPASVPRPTIKGLSWVPSASLSPRLTSPQQGFTRAPRAAPGCVQPPHTHPPPRFKNLPVPHAPAVEEHGADGPQAYICHATVLLDVRPSSSAEEGRGV